MVLGHVVDVDDGRHRSILGSDMSCSVRVAYVEHSSVTAAVVVLSVLLLRFSCRQYSKGTRSCCSRSVLGVSTALYERRGLWEEENPVLVAEAAETGAWSP
jgi:hypothetical protein